MLLVKLISLNKYSVYDLSSERTKLLSADELMSVLLRLGFSMEQYNKLENSLWRCREHAKLLDVENRQVQDLEMIYKQSPDASLMQIFQGEEGYPIEPSRNEKPGRIFVKSF